MQRSKFKFNLTLFSVLFLHGVQNAHSRGMFDRLGGRGEETVEFTSTIPDFNFQLIRAAGKSFMMGSPEDEENRHDDENGKDGKQVEVTFTKDFEIMTTEVTQRQWFDVMKKNPSGLSNSNDCDNHIYLQNGQGSEVGLCPNHPVERISWDRVQVFIEELNTLYGISGCDGTPESFFWLFPSTYGR